MKLLKALRLTVLVLALAPILTGCRPDPFFRMNPSFSVNVAEPLFTEETMVQLSGLERDIYDRYGEPDYIRFRWNKLDQPGNRLKNMHQLKAPQMASLERSWLYLDKNLEILFKRNTEIETKSIADRWRTICLYGDPDEILEHTVNREDPYINYVYYGEGVRFKFDMDGNLVQESRFPRMRR